MKNIFYQQIPNSLPYVVRKTTNNGIRGYIAEDINFANEPNTLSFAQDTFTVFYQKQKYFTGNKVKILIPKFKFTENNMSFIVSCFHKSLEMLSWGTGSTIQTIENIKISLPTKDNKIDFQFMESLISELEEERISKLEAYLKISGLDNYELTDEELKSIDDYNDALFEDYNITTIFDIKNTKNILSRDIILDSGTTPYLCASSENNSVSSYIDYDVNLIDKGDCIFIGGKTFVVSYQEKDFYSNDSHNLALYLKNYGKNKYNQLYLATCVEKSLSHKYSWGNSVSSSKIKNDVISLPTKDKEVNFKSMDTFITAIQKLVIKDVIEYTDRKINTTKHIVKNKR